MKSQLLYLFVTLLFSACNDSAVLDDSTTTMPIVIEGWIEENEAPVVMITRAIDLTSDIDSIGDITEKWGRVTIFDNEEPHILIGRRNKDYTPSFIFTSSSLKGKEGHTYRLLVETDNEVVSSTTFMLPSSRLQPLEAVKVSGEDSLYYILAKVNELNPDYYYKLFEQRVGIDTRFYPSFLGSFKGSEYEEKGMRVTRGIHSGYGNDDFSHYYKSGEIVRVKLYTLEKEIYDFWEDYDKAISLSQNLFFIFDEGCSSNIDGGKGYWAAYGSSSRAIQIP